MKSFHLILFLACLSPFKLLSQEREISGLVLNKNNRQRLAKAYIYNKQLNKGGFNDLRGQFKIRAKPGDTIMVALNGYFGDTIIYKNQVALYFELKPTAIELAQVNIKGKETPREILKKTLVENKQTLEKGSTKNMITIGPMGAGISIDALYNLISRAGKNARRFEKKVNTDFKSNTIERRFNKTMVQKELGISGAILQDFMSQYRPTYQFATTASPEDFSRYIRNAYKRYLKNPAAYRLDTLSDTTQYRK